MSDDQEWKRCSACKKAIPFSTSYYVCSVSTCTRKRTGFVFCSVECWETHVPMMRHREAWAVEETAPSAREWAEQSDEDAPRSRSASAERSGKSGQRRQVVTTRSEQTPQGAPREVLVVASRLKHYLREVHGLSTSDAVLDVLSDHLRRLCNRAASEAKQAERKTVLERDFDWLQGPSRSAP